MSRQAADPSSAWRLAAQPAIVGRERELGLLREIVEQAVAGHGGLVLLAGEAGIGKTTLSGAISREASEAGILVLSGGCYDLTTTPPYGPWVEVLRDYPGGEDLPEMPAQLQAGGGMAGIDSQAALFDLVGRFLKSVAAEQPLLILLEDLHWADPASLDLLRYLSRTLAGEAALLLATYRDDEIGRDHPLARLLPSLVREGQVHRMQLQRLDREAVLAMARERYRLVDDDEARLMAYLDRLAEGNPFFTNELLYTLEERQILSPAAGGWRLGDLTDAGVPTLVQQVIDGRLARLEDSPRALLDLAAVIGYDAPLDLLTEMHEGSSMELDVALQRLIDQRLLEVGAGGSTVRFHHALVRQAIYEEIPLFQRRALHRRVGELLAGRSRPDPAPIADQFHAAGDERALEWLIQAAEQARSLFAPEAVIAECDRAAELATHLGAEAPLALYRFRGLARESLGDFDGARADHETALERAQAASDQGAEWQALLDLATLWASRDYQQTRAYCERAVDLSRTIGDAAALGHSLNRLGNWYVNDEQATDALRHHAEALQIFHTIEDRGGIAYSLDFMAADNFLMGRLGRALSNYERAIPLLRSIDEQQTLSSSLANAAMASWGDWASHAHRIHGVPASLGGDRSTHLTESIEIARSIAWRSGEAYALSGRGLTRASTGRLRSGLEDLTEAMAIAQEINHDQWRIQIHLRFGAVFLALRLSDLASTHLEHALSIANAVSSSFSITGAVGLLASTYVQRGDLLEAARLLEPIVDLARPPEMFSLRVCWFAVVELLAVRDQHLEALDAFDLLVGSIPGMSGTLSPELLHLRARVLYGCGWLDEAVIQADEACGTAVRLGHSLVLWRIRALQRKLYLAQGRVEEADEARKAALRIINGLADQLDDEELRETFLTNALAQIQGAVPYAPDRAAESSPGGLTGREIEVLRLVARGMTDAEVSEELFISPRTVSQHLRSVYNKLGVNNRTTAALWAAEQGLV